MTPIVENLPALDVNRDVNYPNLLSPQSTHSKITEESILSNKRNKVNTQKIVKKRVKKENTDNNLKSAIAPLVVEVSKNDGQSRNGVQTGNKTADPNKKSRPRIHVADGGITVKKEHVEKIQL